MSYNGSGTFQINTSGQPVVAGTVISSTAFNALTADLATGLSTAITKDGQTTTTARIPFAAGINSSLTTDSSSVSTGSIITAGGVGVAKALYVGTTANVASTTDSSSISTGAIVTAGGAGIAKNLYVGANANVAGTLGVTGVATFSAAPIYSSLTASSAVATDASKALVSVTNTGTGNNVLATSPTLVTPVLGAASATSITVAAGTVSDPAITTTGDTNTGIFFPAADQVGITTGGTQRAVVDASGNVGIGTSSPADNLHVYVNTNTENGIRVQNANASGQSAVQYYNNAGTQKADVWWNNSGSIFYLRTLSTDPMVFSTNNTERMRIDSNGYLLVNQTSNATSSYVQIKGAQPALSVESTSTGNVSQIIIRNPNGTVGSISTSGSSTTYNTSSDYRLKEAIAPMTGALAKVALLKPCTYKWKVDGSDGEGFIAHELAQVCPDAVTGEKDGEQMQGVDYGKLTPILTAALQEAISKIETLEARIAVLEAK